ncbi:MAG: FHA domain-containing protein [Labilithrix sp.]|nr:FHA domain-containing protein [Labilithrix sp.]MCW5816391.1 FHA domain-containing protein [Labilithrix sp.]
MDSHVRAPHPRGNVKTECFPEAPAPRLIPDLRAAYAFARGVVKSSPDTLGGRSGHRIVFIRKAAFGGVPLVAHPDAFVVVGRHSQCGLVLHDDPFVSLRHLLVRSVGLPSGKVALRLLDLHTDMGFTLADGSRQSSVFAEGPVAVGLGEYAIVALPNESEDDELPNDLPTPVVEELPPRPAGNPYREPAPRSKGSNRLSRITLMPMSVVLGSQVPAANLGNLTSSSRWAVTLERKGHTATVSVTAQDLVGGVVIGRSEKCISENLRRITDSCTSRLHVLFLREGEKVHAFDLASTHGISVEGTVVRHLEVSDHGAVLLLGSGDTAVRCFWRRVA